MYKEHSMVCKSPGLPYCSVPFEENPLTIKSFPSMLTQVKKQAVIINTAVSTASHRIDRMRRR